MVMIMMIEMMMMLLMMITIWTIIHRFILAFEYISFPLADRDSFFVLFQGILFELSVANCWQEIFWLILDFWSRNENNAKDKEGLFRSTIVFFSWISFHWIFIKFQVAINNVLFLLAIDVKNWNNNKEKKSIFFYSKIDIFLAWKWEWELGEGRISLDIVLTIIQGAEWGEITNSIENHS